MDHRKPQSRQSDICHLVEINGDNLVLDAPKDNPLTVDAIQIGQMATNIIDGPLFLTSSTFITTLGIIFDNFTKYKDLSCASTKPLMTLHGRLLSSELSRDNSNASIGGDW